MKKMLFLAALIGCNTLLAGRKKNLESIATHKNNGKRSSRNKEAQPVVQAPQLAVEVSCSEPIDNGEESSRNTQNTLTSEIKDKILEVMRDQKILKEKLKAEKREILGYLRILSAHQKEFDKSNENWVQIIQEKKEKDLSYVLTKEERESVIESLSINVHTFLILSQHKQILKSLKKYESDLKKCIKLIKNNSHLVQLIENNDKISPENFKDFNKITSSFSDLSTSEKIDKTVMIFHDKGHYDAKCLIKEGLFWKDENSDEKFLIEQIKNSWEQEHGRETTSVDTESSEDNTGSVDSQNSKDD